MCRVSGVPLQAVNGAGRLGVGRMAADGAPYAECASLNALIYQASSTADDTLFVSGQYTIRCEVYVTVKVVVCCCRRWMHHLP